MKIFYLCVLYIVISGCASTQTSYSYNDQADFGAYRTFNFLADEAALPSDSAYRKFLVEAATDQLLAKGLSQSDHPDVLIDVKLLIQSNKKEVPVTERTYLYNPAVYIRSEPVYETKKTKTTTIFIRVLDANKKQMVWQGQGSGTFDESLSKSNVHHAVAQILKKYPPDVKRN